MGNPKMRPQNLTVALSTVMFTVVKTSDFVAPGPRSLLTNFSFT